MITTKPFTDLRELTAIVKHVELVAFFFKDCIKTKGL